MMLVPKKNSFDLFDDFFEDEFFPTRNFFTKRENNLMKTDIKETKDKYALDIDLPGFEKQNIDLSLKDGYLNINAKINKEEKHNEEEKYIRRERYISECSRTFYVGEEIKEDDIKAEFKNGILKIEIPKKEKQIEKKEKKQIPIN